MKKIFYAICGLLAAGKVNAMDFNQDLTEQIDMIRLSDEFISKMQSCTPFIEHKNAGAEGHSLTMNIKSKVRLTANAAVLFPLLHKSEIL